MSRLAFVVNDLASLHPDQSTAMWMGRAARRGHDVHVVAATDLDVGPRGEVRARARPVGAAFEDDRAASVASLRASEPDDVDLEAFDAVVVRVNPGREDRGWLTEVMLQQLVHLRERGTTVINDPVGLQRAASKLYLSAFPERARPRTLVTHHPGAIRAFLVELGGPAVLKPLRGSRGQDVFRVSGPAEANLNQIIDVVTRNGPAMVQAFVPEAIRGDVRVLLIDGELMVVEGQAAMVARVPGPSDFRSNVAVGGRPDRAEITDGIRELVRTVAPRLRADGLFLVGLDVIGDRIVEINVFAAGGFLDAERLYGLDFVTPLVEALERRIGA